MKPNRRFEVEIKAGGDTLKDLEAMLDHFMEQISKGGTKCVTGGASAGGYFELRENPGMTHEIYIQQLDEHLEANK
jgi:hypothetical protein